MKYHHIFEPHWNSFIITFPEMHSVLASYYALRKMPDSEKITQKCGEANFLLDSGAYSAFTQNDPISVYEYIEFVKKYWDIIDCVAGLDVIGDAEASMENQKIMEDAGIDAIPTFHLGEDYKYLKNMVDEYEYIALGGTASSSVNTANKIAWFDKCFSEFICDEKGYPKIKVHGFGVGSFHIIKRYPFYSVDSTAPLHSAVNGSCMAVNPQDGGKSAIEFVVSNNQLGRKGHIQFESQATKEKLLEISEIIDIPWGVSKIVKVDGDYELKDNEAWIEKGKSIDRKVEDGVINSRVLRIKWNMAITNLIMDNMDQDKLDIKKRKSFKDILKGNQ